MTGEDGLMASGDESVRTLTRWRTWPRILVPMGIAWTGVGMIGLTYPDTLGDTRVVYSFALIGLVAAAIRLIHDARRRRP